MWKHIKKDGTCVDLQGDLKTYIHEKYFKCGLTHFHMCVAP